jgi:hypothetical protein
MANPDDSPRTAEELAEALHDLRQNYYGAMSVADRCALFREAADRLEGLGVGDALLKACDSIADDYMTSEDHHPGYVLIPTAKFEAIRSALAVGNTTDGADGR